jgi:hypothetical protein
MVSAADPYGRNLGFLDREMSTRSRKIMFLGSRAWQVCMADNLTAICESIVLTMWGPQHLTTLQASMARYKDSSD